MAPQALLERFKIGLSICLSFSAEIRGKIFSSAEINGCEFG